MTPLTSCDLCLTYRPENILKKGKTNQFHLQDVFLSASFKMKGTPFLQPKLLSGIGKLNLEILKYFQKKGQNFMRNLPAVLKISREG